MCIVIVCQPGCDVINFEINLIFLIKYLAKNWKYANINIVQNFGNVQNNSIIYRHGIYNLQTGSVTFPNQEKLLEKVDSG